LVAGELGFQLIERNVEVFRGMKGRVKLTFIFEAGNRVARARALRQNLAHSGGKSGVPVNSIFKAIADIFTPVPHIFSSIADIFSTVANPSIALGISDIFPTIPDVFATVTDVLAPVTDILPLVPRQGRTNRSRGTRRLPLPCLPP